MEKIISHKDRKQFYHISLVVLGAYVTMLLLALISSVLNYVISKNNIGDDAIKILKAIALILSTVHSIIVVINWFAVKLQRGRIDYVKSTTFATVIVLVMDVLSTMSVVSNTITSLINGGVLSTNATWLTPTMSLLTTIISLFNFCWAVYFALVAKKAVATRATH